MGLLWDHTGAVGCIELIPLGEQISQSYRYLDSLKMSSKCSPVEWSPSILAFGVRVSTEAH